MKSLMLTNMTWDSTGNDFGDSYTIQHMVLENPGWKVVYAINDEEFYVGEIKAYVSIRNGSYYEFIPITHQEFHLPQSLPEYILKDGYVGLINPENFLLPSSVEDNEHLNVGAIEEALRKSRIKLNCARCVSIDELAIAFLAMVILFSSATIVFANFI